MRHGHLYRQIVSSLTDGIVALDLDGTVRFANPAAEVLLRADSLEGRHMHDFLDEAGRRHSREHLSRAAQGTLLDDEVDTMLVRADGTPLWVRLRQTGLVEDDRYVGVILRLTDNHETKQLLEEAHESRRSLMRAERIARSGSWTWDVAAGSATHSEGLEELYGDHVVDLLAADRGRVTELTHPEDAPRLLEALDRLISGDGPRADIEMRQRGRNGWMWVRLRAWGTYDATGALTEVSGTFQDITRARDTEDQLQDLVTQNSLMQAVATAANEATTLDEVLTLAGSMVVLHDDWDRARAFVPDPDGDGVVPHLGLGAHPEPEADADADADPVDVIERTVADEAYRSGRSVWDPERRLTLAAPVRVGDDIVAVVTITSLPPLFRHDMVQQMVEQASLLISRVAEREAYSLALSEARDRALEVSQHKSDFLTTMSHEIRTPLNGIIGLNELLGATNLSDRQRHLVSGVAVSSRALLELINDILDFSKIEAGRLEVESVDFEVRELLAEVGDMLADTARSRELDLRVSCSAEVPDVLRGDPTRLRQVLLNLGSNALKFTKVGSVDIRASATMLEPAEDGGAPRCLLRLDVADTGMGMTASQREHVFAPFAQADTSTTRRFGGTGLGLAICTEIVAAFGGDIGVETEPGAGSTFWFTAPLPVATGGPADAALATARRALRDLKVLVVDSDPQDRTLLSEQLRWWGVSAGEVGSVEQVAAALARGRHDAVLLGSAALDADGGLAEAVDRLGLPGGLPVVLLTPSYVATDSALRAAGVATCLAQPVSSSALRDALLMVRPGGATRRGPVPVLPGASGQEGRGRVLVVEDNQINQLVARGFLEAMGVTVLTADDGESALALLEAQTVDAVLMDVQMPGMDGLETTRALRRRERETGRTRLPVLALTAAAISGERERCLSSGMDDFLTKPISAAALDAALERWLPTSGTRTATERRQVQHPPSPHLDQVRLAELLDIGPGAETYVDRAIDNFLNRRSEVISGITRAVEDADAPALRALAHALRGSAGNLGLPTVSALATRLEAGGDDGTTEGLMLLVVDLATALAQAAQALTDYRGRMAQA